LNSKKQKLTIVYGENNVFALRGDFLVPDKLSHSDRHNIGPLPGMLFFAGSDWGVK